MALVKHSEPILLGTWPQLLMTSPDNHINEFLAGGHASVDISDKVRPPNAEDSLLTTRVQRLQFLSFH